MVRFCAFNKYLGLRGFLFLVCPGILAGLVLNLVINAGKYSEGLLSFFPLKFVTSHDGCAFTVDCK